MSRFFDLLVATEVYADIDFIMSPTEDGKTETFYLEGTLSSLTVDWGDGTTTTASTTNTHTYTSAGDYRVRVLGDCRAVTKFAIVNTYSTSVYYDITEVNNVNLPNATSASYMFFYCNRLAKIHRLDVPNATSYFHAFNNCNRLTHLPEGFKVLNATNTYFMFNNCTRLTRLPSGFTCPNSTSFSQMFKFCSSLVSIPDGFTFSSADGDYYGLFHGCTSLTSLPTSLTDKFQYATSLRWAFYNCYSLVWTPSASVFWERTSPQVVYNGCTFAGCTSLTNYADIPTSWKDYSTTMLYQPPNE